MDGLNKDTLRGDGTSLPPPMEYGRTGTIDYDILNESDEDIVETLAELFNEGGFTRGEVMKGNTEESASMIDDIMKDKKKVRKKLARGDIRNYFEVKEDVSLDKRNEGNMDSRSKYKQWCVEREANLRKSADKSSFNEAIKLRCKATALWRRNNRTKRDLCSGQLMKDNETSAEKKKKMSSIQDFDDKPVLIGGDAIALYPSMDMIGTTEMVARAVAESKVEFRNINLKFLMIYLFLVLGGDVLKEYGLGDYVPKRTNWKDSKAQSLASQINRDINNWSVKTDNISWEEERMMVTLMVKIAVLALLDSTCYSFGGCLFKQLWGAGIGLRASACMAKIIMGMIDMMWARLQMSWDIKIYLYFRYIDDLRIFLHPISKGWYWDECGWRYDEDKFDDRSPMERTKQELAKSLNAVTDFIQFTTEGEEDFNNLFLPTLDFQTQVQESGKILFKFFSKPMANNISIQYGTGLSRNIIFSSLRQELIRRMLNCSIELDWDERMHIVEDFVQLLINSGHRYPFIKSVTLQALTKYKHMLKRASLDHEDIKFRPLYRSRDHDQLKRKISKMVEGMTWYSGVETYDRFKNDWKKKILYKRNRGGRKCKITASQRDVSGEGGKDIVCAMFVPPSEDATLFKCIEEAELKLTDMMDWRIKLVEQSGIPLGSIFIPKFPLESGCPKGVDCLICSNTGVKCSKKGVIYKANCAWCKKKSGQSVAETSSNLSLLLQDQEEMHQSGVPEYSKDGADIHAGTSGDLIDVTVHENKEPVDSVDEMNKSVIGWGCDRPVAMDDMNKLRKGWGCERPVAMDEMNKLKVGGGGWSTGCCGWY